MAPYPAGRVVDVEALVAHEEAILRSGERGAPGDDATPLAMLFIMSLGIHFTIEFIHRYLCTL